MLAVWIVLAIPVVATLVAARYYRKPIKDVIATFFHDASDLVQFSKWRKFVLDRVTNLSTYGALGVNAILYWPSISGDPIVQEFMSHHPLFYLAGVVAFAVASRKNGAPHAIAA